MRRHFQASITSGLSDHVSISPDGLVRIIKENLSENCKVRVKTVNAQSEFSGRLVNTHTSEALDVFIKYAQELQLKKKTTIFTGKLRPNLFTEGLSSGNYSEKWNTHKPKGAQ